MRRFQQLDVFTAVPLKGNPLAVVLDAEGLSDEQMQAFARWTNLSETTFLLPPTDPAADYRVRIFTTARELPFAGHPTLGSCHAWLAGGGQPRGEDVVQQCGVGLVRVRRDGDRLAFAAPPLLRSGALDDATLAKIRLALGLTGEDIVAHQWVDNGPGWCAVMLRSREQLLAIRPDFRLLAPLELGVVAPIHKVGAVAPGAGEAQFEVRALLSLEAVPEDPVTGSLNAGLAQWLIGAGLASPRYVAAQGTVLGRDGRVFVEQIGDTVWIGGHVTPLVEGQVRL
ncbi:PhzF family phenazine biosynthesis protein [Inhella sp.]|uniref:PhzF family phenazine biosynthesis protein n=1 Tax=Inhella sp. TaxID=1921806 RepID=UPI0035B48E0C